MASLIALHPDCTATNELGEDFVLGPTPHLVAYVDGVLANHRGRPNPATDIEDRLSRSIGDGIEAFFRRYAVDADLPTIVAKTPNAQGIEHFSRFFPDGRLVIAVRHPLNVVASALKSFPWMDFEYAIHDWDAGARHVLDVIEAEAGNPHLRVFRYEDLWKSDPAAVSELISFTGLDIERYEVADAAAMPVLNSSDDRDASGRLQWTPRTRSSDFDPSDRASSWTSAERDRLWWVVGDTARRLGYEVPELDDDVAVRNRLADARWAARRAGATVKRRARSWAR